MNYLSFMWFCFWLDHTRYAYVPLASAVCKIIMPCMPEWKENYQQPANNDNVRLRIV